MRFIDIEQGSPEWHELRKTKIGASMAPIIMGASPYSTAYELWQQMVELADPTPVNEFMQRGLDLEGDARDAFTNRTRIKVSPKVGVSSKYEWMMASFDGISDDNKTIVEIKCPGKKDHTTASKGKTPEHYYAQVQHQIAVAESANTIKKAYYFSYAVIPNYLIEVKPDYDYIDKMIEKEKEFIDCVRSFKPPELIERDYITREDNEWRQLTEQWISADSQLNYYAEEEKLARQKLIQHTGQYNTKGFGVRIKKMLRKGSVDYAIIPELENVNLDQYRKENSYYYKVSMDR